MLKTVYTYRYCSISGTFPVEHGEFKEEFDRWPHQQIDAIIARWNSLEEELAVFTLATACLEGRVSRSRRSFTANRLYWLT
jgi:hypothetical protein